MAILNTMRKSSLPLSSPAQATRRFISTYAAAGRTSAVDSVRKPAAPISRLPRRMAVSKGVDKVASSSSARQSPGAKYRAASGRTGIPRPQLGGGVCRYERVTNGVQAPRLAKGLGMATTTKKVMETKVVKNKKNMADVGLTVRKSRGMEVKKVDGKKADAKKVVVKGKVQKDGCGEVEVKTQKVKSSVGKKMDVKKAEARKEAARSCIPRLAPKKQSVLVKFEAECNQLESTEKSSTAGREASKFGFNVSSAKKSAPIATYPHNPGAGRFVSRIPRPTTAANFQVVKEDRAVAVAPAKAALRSALRKINFEDEQQRGFNEIFKRGVELARRQGLELDFAPTEPKPVSKVKKTVTFINTKTATVNFSPNSAVKSLKEEAACSSTEWLVNTRGFKRSQTSFPGRAKENMFVKHCLTGELTLHPTFLSRFAAAQRDLQRQKDDHARAGTVPFFLQRQYGNKNYKIDLEAKDVVTLDHIGKAGTMYGQEVCLFGCPQIQDEIPEWKECGIPKDVVEAYAEPKKWPVTENEKTLEKFAMGFAMPMGVA